MTKKKKVYKKFSELAEKTLGKEIMKKVTARADEEIKKIKLADLREKLGIKQEEVEGFTQSGVSKLEGRHDMRISTIAEYLKALGFNLQIRAVPKSGKKDDVILYG